MSAEASSSSSGQAASAAASRAQRPFKGNFVAKNELAELRLLTADSDSAGVWVYQAYKPSIGLAAVQNQSFAGIPDFNTKRMTWIKFSLGWMLYRCDYARGKDQEVVLRIKLSWDAFWTILRAGVGGSFGATSYATRGEFNSALVASEVRWQWDPERNLRIQKLGNNQRALQLGLKESIGHRFATDPTWILAIVDYTTKAKEILAAIEEGRELPAVPQENEIKIEDQALRFSLGLDVHRHGKDEQEVDLDQPQPAADSNSKSIGDIPPAA